MQKFSLIPSIFRKVRQLNTPRKGNAILLILALLYTVHSLMLHILKYDNSLQLADTSHREVKGSVWMMSYADGDEVYFANQNALTQSAINKGIDFMLNYNRSHLDSSFVKNNLAILSQKRGAGYWLWKPYLLLKTLEMMPKDDILVYVDTGIKIVKDITPLINLTNEKDIIVFKNYYKSRGYIKRDTMIAMHMDKQEYLDHPLLLAGLLIFKNTALSQAIVKRWLELCQDQQMLTDTPSIHRENSDFIEHRHDQSILTLMYLADSKNFLLQDSPLQNNSGFFYLHHRKEDRRDLTIFATEDTVGNAILHLLIGLYRPIKNIFS